MKDSDEARHVRASRILAGELLRHVAHDVDVQLSQLEQMSVDEVQHLIDQALHEPTEENTDG